MPIFGARLFFSLQMKNARKSLNEETENQINALLTEEQKELYKKYKEEQRSKMIKRGQGRQKNKRK